MPGCVLRVSGEKFNADAFLHGSSFTPCKVWHRGDPRPGNRPPQTTSGFNVAVSDAEDLPTEVSDAIAFLNRFRADMAALKAQTTATDLVLDFGVPGRDVAAQFDRFPSELVQVAAEFRLSLEMSHYWAFADRAQ
jgi:hypothetical protein